MGRSKSSIRTLVEDCFSVSVPGIPDLPRGFWLTTQIDITSECRTCKHSVTIPVEVSRTKQGPRYSCPRCRRKVQKLYHLPDAPLGNLACRLCLGLPYRSQYEKSRSAGLLQTLAMLQERRRIGARKPNPPDSKA